MTVFASFIKCKVFENFIKMIIRFLESKTYYYDEEIPPKGFHSWAVEVDIGNNISSYTIGITTSNF